MSWIYAIIIVLIMLIMCIYLVGYLHDNGTIPSDPFKDSIEHMKRSINRTYDQYVTKPEDLYASTIGHVKDDIVTMAVEKTAKKELMNKRNEDNGTLSNDNLLDATTNAFMLAELTRFNIAPNEPHDRTAAHDQDIAEYYGRTINRINRNPTAVIGGDNANQPAIETMILRAEDFYEDAVARQTLAPELIPNFDVIRDGVRAARVNAARTTIPKYGQKKKEKKKNPKLSEKQQAQENYFEEREIRNDPQNVHDKQANQDMLNKYTTLIETNLRDERDGIPKAKLQDIKKYINKHTFDDPKKKDRALKAFEKICEGNHVSHINASDSDVLLNVWERAYSPDNDGKKDDMLPVIIDSMIECVEPSGYGGDYLICAHGRAQHLLDSLTLIDSNKTLSKSARTAETLRNEVFSRAHSVIENELKATNKDIARAYSGTLDEPRPGIEGEVEALEQRMRDRIEDTLNHEYGDVDKKVLRELIKDAQAGV